MKVIFTIPMSVKHLNSLVGIGVQDLLISYLYVRKSPTALRRLATTDLEDTNAIQPVKVRRRKLNVPANSEPLFPIRSSKSGKARIIKPAVRTGTQPLGF